MAQQMPDADIAAARDQALEDDSVAWDFVEGITTEIGPRMAGTEDEARGREWAMRWLRAQGFSNVRDEPFTMRTWVRGEEEAEIVSPFPQPMHVTALGNSASTGTQGLIGEVAVFPSRAALEAVPDGSLGGKIAYVSHGMKPTQDGSGYGLAGPARWTGASLAEKKGASAIVIKSIGTDHHRNPHAGGTTFDEGQDAIPAGALSIPDAENLERMAERAAAAGKPLMLKLTLTPRDMGQTTSGNVIAEIPGSDPEAGVALLACHLDSWDLATGAFDDGAGCGIIAAAAKRVAAMGQPRRTIRLLFAGAEEVGVFGGKAYGAAHKDEAHAFAMESDFGADKVWRPSHAAGRPAGRAARADGRGARHAACDRRCRHRRDRRSGRAGRHRPAAGRDALFRPAPHPRRHAGQDRSSSASPECRGVDGDGRIARQCAG